MNSVRGDPCIIIVTSAWQCYLNLNHGTFVRVVTPNVCLRIIGYPTNSVVVLSDLHRKLHTVTVADTVEYQYNEIFGTPEINLL